MKREIRTKHFGFVPELIVLRKSSELKAKLAAAFVHIISIRGGRVDKQTDYLDSGVLMFFFEK